MLKSHLSLTHYGDPAYGIAEALQTIAPAALDINSGVESEPGKKDHAKLTRIFDIILAADSPPDNALLIFTKRGK